MNQNEKVTGSQEIPDELNGPALAAVMCGRGRGLVDHGPDGSVSIRPFWDGHPIAQVMSPGAPRRVQSLPLPGDGEAQRQAITDLTEEARKYD